MTAANQKQAIKVIADSNALFVPVQFKIDIFSEFCNGEVLNLQVGGKATTGKGRVRCLFTKGEGE